MDEWQGFKAFLGLNMLFRDGNRAVFEKGRALARRARVDDAAFKELLGMVDEVRDRKRATARVMAACDHLKLIEALGGGPNEAARELLGKAARDHRAAHELSVLAAEAERKQQLETEAAQEYARLQEKAASPDATDEDRLALALYEAEFEAAYLGELATQQGVA